MISIIIPVYNSDKTIAKVVKEISENLREKYKYEIILIDDGSIDNSDEVCKELISQFNNVALYSLSKNFGEHNAIIAGLNNSNGDFAIIVEDDLQSPVESIIKMIEYGVENSKKYDVVYASYIKKKYGFIKNLTSKLNDICANIILKKPPKLYLSSLKILNRFMINEIVKNKTPYVYIDGLIFGISDKIGSVKLDHNEREVGKSGYTYTKLIRLWLSMFTGFSLIPLRISTVFGLLLSLFGFLYALFTIIDKIFYNNYPSGYPSLIIFILIFSGAILLALGILGEYVGRVFLSLNQKPQYIIKEIKKKNN
jgi:glycosyltransferase involved in cell wall biosynthesis